MKCELVLGGATIRFIYLNPTASRLLAGRSGESDALRYAANFVALDDPLMQLSQLLPPDLRWCFLMTD